MKTDLDRRAVAPDVIRCFALFTVVSVHFFLFTDYLNETVAGPRMFLMTFLRSFFLVCVPMFLLLSGYLLRTKPLTKRYFFKLAKTLSIYLLASFVCILYKAIFYRSDFSIIHEAYGIFSFSTAPYAWYIEMYIGLFLLIPFLNILYNNLQTQRQEQLLLLVMLCLTALPSVINIHRVFELQWWLDPASSQMYYHLIPDWWTGFYPITYYFFGCYLSKHPLKLKPAVNLLWILLVTLAFSAFNFYRSHNTTYVAGPWQSYESLFIVVQSVLVFNFFLRLDYSRLGAGVRSCLARLSDWCLGGFLVSWVFDDAFYKLLAPLPDAQHKFPYFLLIVPAVYLCSLGCSAFLHLFYGLLQKHLFPLFQGKAHSKS